MALTKITPQMFDTSATAHDLNVDNGTFVVDGSASNVGIGTTTQSFSKLQVKAATDQHVSIFTNTKGLTIGGITDAGGSAALRIAGSPLRFSGSGGGTTAGPHLEIDTSGNSTFSGDIFANTDSTHDIGTNVTRFANAYFDTIYGSIGTGSQPSITSLGTLTALTVDDITINGSTISDAGDFTIDVGGDINLDADGADIVFLDGGTQFGQIRNNSGLYLISNAVDASMYLRGNDNGGYINGLTIDFQNAGAATFNAGATFGGGVTVGGTSDGAAGTITLQSDGDIRGVLASGAGGDTIISAISGVSNGYQIAVDTSNNQTYKWFNGSAQSMTLSSSGNLGIGAASPAFGSGSGLEVSRSGTATVRVERTGSTASSGEFFAGNGKVVLSSISNNHLEFRTNNTEAMRIDSSGNVGISATPSGEAAAAHVIRLGDRVCITEYDDSSNPEQFNLFHNSNSSEKYIETGTASVIQQRAGEIVFKNAVSGSAGATISFQERMRINSDGLVGIGTNNPGRGLTIDVVNAYAAVEVIKNNTGNSIAYLGTGSSGAGDNGILSLKDGGNEHVRLYTTGTSWLTGGNFGVGTSSNISYKLTVSSTDTNVAVFDSDNDNGTYIWIRNSDAVTGRSTSLGFAPANNIEGSRISSTATEDFSTSANRTADITFLTRLNGNMQTTMTHKSNGTLVGPKDMGSTSFAGLRPFNVFDMGRTWMDRIAANSGTYVSNISNSTNEQGETMSHPGPNSTSGYTHIVYADGPITGVVAALDSTAGSSSGWNGGWGGTSIPVNPHKPLLFTTYVRKVHPSPSGGSEQGSGQFYFGCSNCYPQGTSTTANSNPYFVIRATNAMVHDEWYLLYCILYPAAYTGTGISSLGGDQRGMWNVRTATRLQGQTGFRQIATQTSQQCRSYLYYAGDSSTELQWCNPGVYVMDGAEPSLLEMLRNPAGLA